VVAARVRRLGPWFLAGIAVTLAALAVAGRWRAPGARPAAGVPVQRTVERGVQLEPDFSPDGSQLVYSGLAGDSLELFVRPLAGGAALQLTGDGPNVEPAWSPDGRWIAYRNQRRGGLWLIAPTGGSPRQLTDAGAQPAWSPDGSTLVYSNPGKATLGALEWPATYDSVLWTVDLGGGAARPLTRPDPIAGGQGMPAWSADGAWVVYATANLVSGGGLWRVPSAGGEPQALVRPVAGRGSERALWHDPQPLPDGSGVYALRIGDDTRIVRVGWREGGPVAPVLAPAPLGAVQLALAADGRQLAFAVEQADSRIEEVRLDAGGSVEGEPRVLVAPAVRRMAMPRYSPDGRRLLALRLRAGSRPEWVVSDHEGREQRVFESTLHAEWATPNEVVALHASQGSLAIDVATGRARQIPRAAWMEQALARGRPRGLDFRHDFGAVVLSEQRSGGRELLLWMAGADRPRQLTSLGGLLDYPFWSSDGRWIGVQRVPRPQLGNELWRLAMPEGKPERVRTGTGPSWGGAFSPDGARMVYAACREGRWHLAVAGPDLAERILAVPPELHGYLRWPDWSADGTRVAYERTRYRSNVWTVELGGDG
jgi:Tol biopolymer transport system component